MLSRESKIFNLLADVIQRAKTVNNSPFECWSNDLLRILVNVYIHDSAANLRSNLENSHLTVPEIVHGVYYTYLRRVADDRALAHYKGFTSVSHIMDTLFQSVLNSEEYHKVGLHPLKLSFHEHVPGKITIFVDVTNTHISKARTGIQRVTREVCAHLTEIPHNHSIQLIHLKNQQFFPLSFQDNELVETPPFKPIIFNRGDLYVDMDASWGDAVSKWTQYTQLKKAGIRIVNIHYDAVPIFFPQYAHPTTVLRYFGHFIAMVYFSDLLLCISHAVRDDLKHLLESYALRIPNMAVIPMGSQHVKRENHTTIPDKAILRFAKTMPFVLCVGTIEPRKNYSLLLTLLPFFKAHHLNVIVIGKLGWEDTSIVNALEEQSSTTTHFRWFKTVDDATLRQLYASCFLYLTTSWYEGYGLPVIEALSHHCLVVSSNKGALPEAGKDFGLFFNPEDPESLKKIIQKLVEDNRHYKTIKNQSKHFKTIPWQNTADAIYQHLQPFIEPVTATISYKELQVVYISISPHNLKKSLSSFVQHIGTSRVLILTSRKYQKDMYRIAKDNKVTPTILCDEDILAPSILQEKDHLIRNFFIRKTLYARREVDPIFIASDDDGIVLRNLNEDHFVRNHRYVGKYFYSSMHQWKSSPFGESSYDRGQWSMAKILSEHGFSDYSFSSHQPQIVDKNLVQAIFSEFSSLNESMDEWSLYFNVATQRYCNKFMTQPVTTLYWPNHYAQWMPTWFLPEVYFENYYPSNYQADGFALNAAITEETDWRLKRLHCQSNYEKYAAIDLINSFVYREKPHLILQKNKELQLTQKSLMAYPKLWLRLPIKWQADETFIELAYRIENKEGKTIINGADDVQTIHKHTNVMVKLPAKPGEYQLKFLKNSQNQWEICNSITLFVLPLHGVK